MPGGGIGPVRLRSLAACAGQDRAIGALGSPNEIFFHLDARRVYYDRPAGYLYYAAAADELIPDTLRAVLAGMPGGGAVEQLHLDVHRCFSAARRIRLDAVRAKAALVALRLVGVRATIGG